jgi:hypothetical protein
MFILVLQNDPNWHTLDRLPVPYATIARSLPTLAHDSEGHLPGLGLNLVALLRELERLREQVRKAELARSLRVDRRKRTRIRRLEHRRRCQRGFFPRPVQVSDGSAGFLNFGETFG